MAGEDLHENANISGDLRSQLSCESGDVGNLSEGDDGNNGKGIRNEAEFQELTVVADQNEPIEASQRKSEAEQFSTGEGKDSLNPDCQQNPGVVTERQDRSEQAPDQKNVTDTKGIAHLTRRKSQKSPTTTVAKRPCSCSEVQKSKLPQKPSTFSKNGMHAIGKKNNRSHSANSVTPVSNGTVAQPTATNKIASTGVQSSDVKAVRCMSATSAATSSTTTKQQANAHLTLPKSQKSSTTTFGKGTCSGSEVQKRRLPQSQNPITPKGVSSGTVAQPAATNERASTIVKSSDVDAASSSGSTTKKQPENAHLTQPKSQKSAPTTVSKDPCSGYKAQDPCTTSKGVSKVAGKNGMNAIGKKKNTPSQDSLFRGAEVMSPPSNSLPLSAKIRSNIQNEKPFKQDEMKEEYEDTGSETSSNSTAIDSKARPGSASSATDFNEKQKEEYQEAENKQPRESLTSKATPISSSCQEAAQPKVELKKQRSSDSGKTSNRRVVQQRQPLQPLDGRAFLTHPHPQHGQQTGSDSGKTSNRRVVQQRQPLQPLDGRAFRTHPHPQHGQQTGGPSAPFLPASYDFSRVPVHPPPVYQQYSLPSGFHKP